MRRKTEQKPEASPQIQIAPSSPPTPDVFLGVWVYCGQHLNPHLSGWCTVGIEDKVGLGPIAGCTFDEQRRMAIEKCERLGLKLYKPL